MIWDTVVVSDNSLQHRLAGRCSIELYIDGFQFPLARSCVIEIESFVTGLLTLEDRRIGRSLYFPPLALIHKDKNLIICGQVSMVRLFYTGQFATYGLAPLQSHISGRLRIYRRANNLKTAVGIGLLPYVVQIYPSLTGCRSCRCGIRTIIIPQLGRFHVYSLCLQTAACAGYQFKGAC